MPELSLKCPHCLVEKAGFSFGGLHPLVQANPIGGPYVTQTWNTLFVCKLCNEGVVVKLRSRSSRVSRPGRLTEHEGDPTAGGRFRVVSVYPKAPRVRAPEHVPKGISHDYESATRCLRRGEFTAAGMMFRKVLEQATLELADDRDAMRRLSLYRRVEALAGQGFLTPSMKDLAHVIRLEGNQAAHDEELGEARARQLSEFTLLFLIYAFLLPERVRRARVEASAG